MENSSTKEMIERARVIRNETLPDANSAQRVGSLLEEIAVFLDNRGTDRMPYADIKQLRTMERLVPGKVYEITDFRTYYDLAGERVSGPVEPLRVLATSASEFSRSAQSAIYPNDTIEYVFSEHEKGRVTYRMYPESRLSAHYDWRAVTFRRYRILGIFHHKVSDGTGTASFEVTVQRKLPTGYFEIYCDFAGSVNAENPTITVVGTEGNLTLPLVRPDGTPFAENGIQGYLTGGLGLVYHDPIAGNFVLVDSAEENESVKGYHSWRPADLQVGNSTVLEVDAGDYQDFHTFMDSEGGGMYDIAIEKDVQGPNNITFTKGGPFVKHISIGSDSRNMTIAHNIAWSIKIGDDSYGNLILNDVSWSGLGDELQGNLFARFLRYINTRRCFNNSFFGSGQFYYFTIDDRIGNTTLRLQKRFGGGNCRFKGLVSCYLNVSAIYSSSFHGWLQNKSTYHGMDMSEYNHMIPHDTEAEYYNEDRKGQTRVKNLIVEDINVDS